MSSTPSSSIDRRDAAVAAALAGAVVVVLGYASGVGIQTSADSVLTQQPPAVQPAAPHNETAAAPPVAIAPAPILTAPVTFPVVQPHEHARPATPHDHTPVEPTPTPTPAPEPTPTCETGLLESVPVAGPLLGAASSVVFGVVRTAPLVSELDPVVCAVTDLLVPTCCATEADARTEAAP